ncbi:hypothetical protein EMPS_01933 [Entomortierella parvispora]|uniref:Uncharacterized protein n=1 Tax=Entomortierella parvispora TaxID=205924 RepID=A0A9P3H3U6_9FUNG|nr:hypothetical protein EMPS_01933 [Entomortierella parvispora]
MPQLLESTRSFLKSSTRLGRRMSNKDESADSSTATETSSNTDHNLHYYSNNGAVRAASVKDDTTASTTTHRPSTHNRLSGLFSRKSLSEENSRPTTPLHGRGSGGCVTVGGAKIGPEEAQEVMMVVSDDNTFGQPQVLNQRHIVLDVGAKDAEAKRRDSKSSERTHQSIKSRQSHQSQLSNSSKNGGSRTEKNNGAGNVAALAHHQDGSSSSPERHRRSHRQREHASAHMENEVPRGRSPTLSMSNSVSTTSSSYGGHSPSFSMTHNEDPASSLHSFSQPSANSNSAQDIKLYQAHVWRRNLLEESIMHSLRLGYADRHRSSSRHRSRHQNTGSSDSHGYGTAIPKKKSSRARKTREQAILAAAMGKELPPFPVVASAASSSDFPATAGSSHDIILDRNIQSETPQRNHNIAQSGQTSTTKTTTTGGSQFLKTKNSPYQLDNYSHSMTNIRNSIASFTLELPEHRASHVMASSMIPNLFRVKARSSHSSPSATTAAANAVAAATSTLASIAEANGISCSSSSSSRRNSRTHLGATALGPSPRVLPGGAMKKPLPPLQIVDPLFPGSSSASVRSKSAICPGSDDQEDDEPVSPATQDWVESVFASLDQVKGFGGQDQTDVVRVPANADNLAHLKRDTTHGVSVSS